VWAAGIRAPEFLGSLGLPVNKGGQIDVDGHLRREGRARRVCAGRLRRLHDGNGKPVPPRAQAAHQQADYLLKTFLHLDKGQPPQKDPYVYRDYGSLVSIGKTTSGQPDGLATGRQLVRRRVHGAHHVHEPAPDAPPGGARVDAHRGCWRWRAS
jgi:NADH dehydrogenase